MITIKLITIGHLPANFNKRKIEKWKTKLFKIDGNIENYSLPTNSDGINWEFSDENLKHVIPKFNNCDFTIAIVNVPLEDNYYARRIDNNVGIITFHEIKEILEDNNIPLENIILNVIYAYILVYLKFNRVIPVIIDTRSFTHDETRGCLFDMTGIKSDVIYSCHNPIICSQCLESLKNDRVSLDNLNVAQKEIRKIKKDQFYIILDFIKKHPMISIIISSFTAIILGTIGSIIASIIFEKYL